MTTIFASDIRWQNLRKTDSTGLAVKIAGGRSSLWSFRFRLKASRDSPNAYQLQGRSMSDMGARALFAASFRDPSPINFASPFWDGRMKMPRCQDTSKYHPMSV